LTPSSDPAQRRPTKTTSQDLYRGFGEAWTAVSTMLAGIIVWGAAGWGLDHLLHTKPAFFITGAVLGNFAGIYLIYVKYFREPESPEHRHAA
jgi:F0F1-type ATP synthase assembly protein I